MKIRDVKDLDPYYTEAELFLMTAEELAAAGFTRPRLFGSPDYYNNQAQRSQKFSEKSKKPY